MKKGNRKHIRLLAMAMSLVVVGMLAAFIALAAQPEPAAAQQDLCDGPLAPLLPQCEDSTTTPGTTPTPPTEATPTPGTDLPADAMLDSSSSTGSVGVKLTLIIPLTENLNSGSWVELYLEDDYQEPGDISTADVIFSATGGTPSTAGTPSSTTGDGGTFDASAVEIDDGGKIGTEEDVVVISARIPDMDPRDDYYGYPGVGQTLTMVVRTSAGIKNPSEQGMHSTGFAIIGGTDDRADVADTKLDDLPTWAKISLSAEDGGRGKEVTITGSGFNNDRNAEAFVLVAGTKPMDCMALVDHDDSESLGTATVGSDDKFSIVFTVHQDEFDAGKVNWICAKDSESEGGNRYSSDVDGFELKDSLSITPATVVSGDEVTLKPRDFTSDTLKYVYLGGTEAENTLMCCGTGYDVQRDGTSDYVFDMPGGYSGSLSITVEYSDGAKASVTITVAPSSLTLNQTEVAPNQSIIISGSGFNDGAEILTSNITIDGKMLKVDDAGTEGSGASRHVSITSSGQFTVTVNVWHDGAGNPVLDADEYTIKVTDSSGYEGKTKITILEPTVMVTPQVAGPRDSITISGTNWPVSTSEDDYDVSIEVDDKTRTASIDSSGRFNYEYRLSGRIGIGEEHDVKVTFDGGTGGNIEEETTFSVPSSNVVITPAAAAPGQTIDLEISGMPIGELVSEVMIDGGNRLGGINLNTDRNGAVTITGIVVPYSEPGFYPVKIEVGTGSSPQIAIVQLEILAEDTVAGVTAALPGALSELGDNLVRIFHFNNSTKVWTFYDPRPEFEGLNTLVELADGQPYWILVSEGQDNVVMNGKTRDLTCVGGDCWNQEVW